MLIFSKALMFLWAEAVATACYTENRSLIHTLHNKTPYELVHDKKPDLTFFRVFGALCYPTNDSEDLRKLQPTADIGIFVGSMMSRTEKMVPVQLSTGQLYFSNAGNKGSLEYWETILKLKRDQSLCSSGFSFSHFSRYPSIYIINKDAPSASHSPSSSVLQSPSSHQR
ncbi:retrovirus-related pol polyprotein from transposon TNT 1-94 [Tanacetum coccineum]|uniref:Retrovirus-related pol polyprotein from transposon TNT 1-94 n=1 Tax=Tanacetum coccineum TaxID=301880 RepID=A0ABQ5B2G6_9ASTR